MKSLKPFLAPLILTGFILFAGLLNSCTNKEESTPGAVTLTGKNIDFGTVGMNAPSAAQEIRILGNGISQNLTATASTNFEVSLDGASFSSEISITPEQANDGIKLQVRCAPTETGNLEGTVTITGYITHEVSSHLTARAVEKLHTISTFNQQRLASGNGFSQSAQETFTFPNNPEKVESITMFVKLRCPDGGCNAWDVFANVRIKDPATDDWMEIGRYITPYGVDNHQLTKGFPIDVTDFKGLLAGDVTLKAFIEVWGADGWLLDVNFELVEGTPDYKYYQISEILDYANHSLAGVPYGETHAFDLEKCLTIPVGAEETSLRTIITGWGHATPNDNGGRPCAEWCFRTHHIHIEDAPLFTHQLSGIGCGSNKVSPQGGNWQPDRAGWCPGMEVPVRQDVFPATMSGESFCYKYVLAPWTNDMQSTATNPHAYYAISSYVVVKSNSPIEKAIVD
jgi:hypothetical protein